MPSPKSYDVSITARGIEDAPLILLTQEMMRCCGIRLIDRHATNSREAALEVLETIASGARKLFLEHTYGEEVAESINSMIPA